MLVGDPESGRLGVVAWHGILHVVQGQGGTCH